VICAVASRRSGGAFRGGLAANGGELVVVVGAQPLQLGSKPLDRPVLEEATRTVAPR
jgi:hypothetical protein